MEVRQVATELPEMLVFGHGMPGIRQAVQVEQWGRESWEDDGEVV